ncbi:MAG: hypothetical protein KJS97_06050 [Alphaproteobacteria bacterium]|nr:hypothetical protein [Alphaproteobacteria bacterium]
MKDFVDHGASPAGGLAAGIGVLVIGDPQKDGFQGVGPEGGRAFHLEQRAGQGLRVSKVFDAPGRQAGLSFDEETQAGVERTRGIGGRQALAQI